MTEPAGGNDDHLDPARSEESTTAGGEAATADDAGPSAAASLSVPEMDCPSCAGKVDGALAGVEGVEDFETRPATGDVSVTFDADTVDEDAVADAVESAGYEVVGHDGGEGDVEREHVWTSARARKTAVAGVLLAAGLSVEFVFTSLDVLVATISGAEFHLGAVLLLGATAAGGQVIIRAGYYSARNLNLDIDFLMSAAILSAVTASLLTARSLYVESATLAVLFNVAELLETYSMDRARSSLRALLELAPDEATVRRAASAPDEPAPGGPDGEPTEVTVPAEGVAVGERVLVRPGEKIPVDGTVLEGETAVDESPVTGESVPADKAPGDEVYAGTINEAGYVELEATAPAGESTLSRVIDLVGDAESRTTDHEQFVDRFAGYYTPVMVALAIAVAAVPPLAVGAPWAPWFVAGITMLVLACPCAFVISTPVSVVSGITSAARNGVLIKGGDHLEAMGEVDAVALDKTGTLTRGELAVTDVVPVGDRTEADVLACARGLEARSEHPIGEAIVEHAAATGTGPPEVDGFESLAGRGVRATLSGTPHLAGKPDLFRDLGFDLSHVHVVGPDAAGGASSNDSGDAASDAGVDGAVAAEVRDRCERAGCLDLAEDTIPRLQAEGKTVVLVGTESELEGVIAVADEVRPGGRRAVERLQALGLRTVMLTGDNGRTARAVAEAVGIDEVRAELLPEDKVAAVERLRADGGVAMVGDGVNDAPALAAATVGVAMGAAGTDAAIETADVALLGDDVSKLPYLRELATRANRVIRQNIWASLGIKAVLAAGVPLQLVGVAVAVLVGDAGMTVGVTGNAMRLAGIEPDGEE
ncbi:MAG: cation-translocating P-type ATPase [Halobacteriales archaeon]